MSYYPHAFEGPLAPHGVGKSRVLWYQVLFLPDALAQALPLRTQPRLRVRGEIGDMPVAGAWMPTGDGRHYFIVSPVVRKATGARLGDALEMRFALDDPYRVDVPAALADALARAPALQAAWDALTAGKRRGLGYPVAQAKSAATVERRVLAVLEALASPERAAAPRRKPQG